VVRCEDLINFIKMERAFEQIKSWRDLYDLGFRLVRRYEYILRRGYNPAESRDVFIEGIISEIALKFSSKRLPFSLSERDARRISSRILDILTEMGDLRSICGLYFQLRKKEEMHHLIDLIRG